MNEVKRPKVGLVLAGGGGKGAFQIGVWKALRASGLDRFITDVSGASVGALNAVLFAYTMSASTEQEQKRRFNESTKIWEKEIGPEVLLAGAKKGELSLCSREGLKDIIRRHVDMNFFNESPFDCYVACVSNQKSNAFVLEKNKISNEYVRYFNLKDRNLSRNERIELLLASSAMPFIYPRVRFQGEILADGGSALRGDNVPVVPLAYKEKCDYILVIHLDQAQTVMDACFKRNYINRSDYPNSTLFEIRPFAYNGNFIDGTTDFNPQNARIRIQKGYQQTYPLFQEAVKIILSGIIIDKSSKTIEDILRKWGMRSGK